MRTSTATALAILIQAFVALALPSGAAAERLVNAIRRARPRAPEPGQWRMVDQPRGGFDLFNGGSLRVRRFDSPLYKLDRYHFRGALGGHSPRQVWAGVTTQHGALTRLEHTSFDGATIRTERAMLGDGAIIGHTQVKAGPDGHLDAPAGQHFYIRPDRRQVQVISQQQFQALLASHTEDLRATAAKSAGSRYTLRHQREPLLRALARFHYPGSVNQTSLLPQRANTEINREVTRERRGLSVTHSWREGARTLTVTTRSYRVGETRRWVCHTRVTRDGQHSDHYASVTKTRRDAVIKPTTQKDFLAHGPYAGVRSRRRHRGQHNARMHLVHGLPAENGVPAKRGVYSKLAPQTQRAALAVGSIYHAEPAPGQTVTHHSPHAGTVFIIAAPRPGRPGLLMTNHHVVKRSAGTLRRRVRFEGSDGKSVLAQTHQVLWASPALDCAVLSFTADTPLPAGVKPLKLSRRAVAASEKLATIGYPALHRLPRIGFLDHAAVGKGFPRVVDQRPLFRTLDGRLSGGERITTTAKTIVVGHENNNGQPTGDKRSVRIGSGSLSGSSGSPVLDKDGAVVALHWGSDRTAKEGHMGSAYAIPMGRILATLARERPQIYARLGVR